MHKARTLLLLLCGACGLRAERAGGGNGRTYTVTITATDALDQSTSRAVQVLVPKNQKAKP